MTSNFKVILSYLDFISHNYELVSHNFLLFDLVYHDLYILSQWLCIINMIYQSCGTNGLPLYGQKYSLKKTWGWIDD